jgi:hypothetical protein
MLSYVQPARCNEVGHIITQNLARLELPFVHHGARREYQDVSSGVLRIERNQPQAFVVAPLVGLKLRFDYLFECFAFFLFGDVLGTYSMSLERFSYFVPALAKFLHRGPHVEPCSRDPDTALLTGTGDGGRVCNSANNESKSAQEAVASSPPPNSSGLRGCPVAICDATEIKYFGGYVRLWIVTSYFLAARWSGTGFLSINCAALMISLLVIVLGIIPSFQPRHLRAAALVANLRVREPTRTKGRFQSELSRGRRNQKHSCAHCRNFASPKSVFEPEHHPLDVAWPTSQRPLCWVAEVCVVLVKL